MDDFTAQAKNAEQRDKFAALLVHVLAEIAEIDKTTVADHRWPNSPPAWWVAMSRVGDECMRAESRL